MTVPSPLPPERWKNRFHSGVDPWYAFGRERLSGRVFGVVFTLRYHNGRLLDHSSLFCQTCCLGLLRRDKEGIKVSYLLFPGMTDPVSAPAFFLFTALLLYLIRSRWGLTLPAVLLAAGGITLFVALLTLFCTLFMEEGGRQQKEIEEFLNRISADDT